MSSYNYTNEFRTALQRSSELSLNVPAVAFQSMRLYSDDAFPSVIDQLSRKFGNPDGTINLIGQCLNIHWNIRREVESAFGCGAHLTIGYVQENEDKYFEFSYPDVEDWLRNGIDLNKVSLHAWLTLDSMDVIDLTWPSTRAEIFNSPHGRGAAITKHPDDFINGLQYHPLVVDNDFPIRIKAIHQRGMGGYMRMEYALSMVSHCISRPNPSFEGTACKLRFAGSLRASASVGPSTQTLTVLFRGIWMCLLLAVTFISMVGIFATNLPH